MSTKHYFPSTVANTLVPKALRHLVVSNPHLHLDEAHRVIANAYHDSNHVAIISGGGSGHEPAWSGYVGDGLLSAVACGDIFASPSTKQIMKAMHLAPSNKGVILLITNYTGDRLHFGLAAEKAKTFGIARNIVVLPATDDVSIGRTKNNRLGRRGLAGHIITMKILGAAAAEGCSFEDCLTIGRATNSNTVTIGSALDHCHVPGRQHQSLPQNTCVIGAGIHNEPAQQALNPIPSVDTLIQDCLKLLCDPTDHERAFVKFSPHDRIVLLINNYGGLSPLELGALADETVMQLESQWQIVPEKILSGTFETSLNAPGFSISLCNITSAASQARSDAATLLRWLDRQTSAVSWPNTHRPSSTAKRLSFSVISDSIQRDVNDEALQFDSQIFETMIRRSCERVIAAEPQLTEWDTVMGDGDCGEAVKGLAESTLKGLERGVTKDGHVLDFLTFLNKCIEDMGGTLGAIFGILLSAFQTALRATTTPSRSLDNPACVYAEALAVAVNALKQHTPAREGDRTVMDVLLPFADEFWNSRDLKQAVRVAADKAEGTRHIKAKLGRATYVGQDAVQDLPDPGAWALYEIIAGLAEGSVA